MNKINRTKVWGQICLFIVMDLICFVGLEGRVFAKSYSFDAAQLGERGRNVDISLFEQDVQLPGVYLVDVLLNGELVDAREIAFNLVKGTEGKPFLQGCLTREQLVRYGVKVEDYPKLFSGPDWNDSSQSLSYKVSSKQCARLSAIPQATETFQFNNQQLLLSIPQIALRPHYQGIAPQELWDDGIPAFLLDYQANAYRSESRGNTSSATNSMNVQLTPGLNLGAWRFRNLTTWQKQGRQEGEWQTSYTYAERGLYSLKSRLTLGERFTPSDVFGSVPFRGGMVGSADNMVPYSQREFAPVVQGIARTQARIEVKQNGYVVYNTSVAPGPYALTDLPVSGGGGDLQVTVFEADGTRQVFTVPYTEPAIALRQGYLKYNLMAGQYRSADTSVDKATVGQATVMYGLPWDLTAYGGVQWANHYQAGTLGVGVLLGNFGAVSLDDVQARGKKWGRNTEQGQRWRIRYSKSFNTTQTRFTLASSQYASSGYSTLSEVLDTYRHGNGWPSQDYWDPDYSYRSYWFRDNTNDKQKMRTSITLSQPLREWGSLSFSGSRENYWNQPQHQDEISARYSGPITKGISWSVDWTQGKHVYRSYGRNTDNSVSLWVSIPFDHWVGEDTSVTYQMQNNRGQSTQHDVGLNGRAFNRRLYWDMRERIVSGSHAGDQDNSNLSLRWDGTYGELSGGYGYSKTSRQMNAGIQGGMVIHRHGVTFGQRLGDTVALVEAPGVSGVSVGGAAGVKTDFRGYTILGYLSPYQVNTITLDPATLPPDAAIPQTNIKVVPTAGAVIPAHFVTRIGGRALITLARANGQSVPFGAVASIEGNTNQQVGAGIVGDDGDVYMTGLPERGHLLVRWGNSQQQHCRVDYQLPETKITAGIYTLKGLCR
ncbi:fimbria/pilus outer membrane usher protein [Edwardsiella piscicida]|nr:fimbria/pilus outer membrane usher protein [Edwardsiella piscicida]